MAEKARRGVSDQARPPADIAPVSSQNLPSPDEFASGDRPASTISQLIERYFGQLDNAFRQAAAKCGQQVRTKALAGRTIRLALAGDALAPILTPALSHLPSADARSVPDLEICAWDTRTSGVPLPSPPWDWPDGKAPHRVGLPAGADRFRLMVTPDRQSLLLYHLDLRRAFLWINDPGLLAAHWYSSPLLRLFHWWGQSRDLHLLHAGCIGTERGGVLFAGRSGAGKSTTSLLCLQAGMRYVSDDNCLLEPGSPAIAHCLYNSGKLHRDHLLRFPDLAHRVIDPRPQDRDKPILFTQRHFTSAVTPRLPLRAILLPQITGRPETQVVRISAIEALRGLAPSTLIQLQAGESQSLPVMARLVRSLICYRLELGTRLEAIAPVIARVIANLPQPKSQP